MGGNVPVPITRLAPELILRVFGWLDIGEATCLGLTCRRFYIVLKDLYPEPISLGTPIVLRGKGLAGQITNLYYVLAKWVGPRYRMCRRTNVKLLYYNIEVYGVAYDSNHLEWRSNIRHSDYQIVQHRYDENYRPDEVSPNPLPNPFDKGDAWDSEAIAIIEASISQFAFTEEWKQFWSCTSLFCWNTKHFKRLRNQYMREIWSDGLELVDFKARLS
jgi:hypothetical protein